jgi:hypothetical protein
MDHGLWIMDCGLWIVDFESVVRGLWIGAWGAAHGARYQKATKFAQLKVQLNQYVIANSYLHRSDRLRAERDRPEDRRRGRARGCRRGR